MCFLTVKMQSKILRRYRYRLCQRKRLRIGMLKMYKQPNSFRMSSLVRSAHFCGRPVVSGLWLVSLGKIIIAYLVECEVRCRPLQVKVSHQWAKIIIKALGWPPTTISKQKLCNQLQLTFLPPFISVPNKLNCFLLNSTVLLAHHCNIQ